MDLVVAFALIMFFRIQHVLCPQSPVERGASAQQRLMKQLFASPQYDLRARPVVNFTDPICVTVRLNLYQLVEVDERCQHVILYAWVTQIWNDHTLYWNPGEYENVTSLVVPYRDIWLPDTYLYNSLKMSRQESERWISAILEADDTHPVNGSGQNDHSKVVFRYPALYKFMCSMDVTYFPFDTQHCRMVFGSWTYDSSGIVFTPETDKVAQEDYQENEEWIVVKVISRNHSEFYTCCPNPFSFIYVDMVLKRRPLHYLVNLFVPILIVSMIANIGFFAPSSTSGVREQKLGLGMSTLLALSIILMMVSDQMPTTSTSIPLVGRFFVGIMIETALALSATAAVLLVHQRGLYGYRVPKWLKRVMFDIVAPAIGVRRRNAFVTLPVSLSAARDAAVVPHQAGSNDSSPAESSIEHPIVEHPTDEVADVRFVLGRKYGRGRSISENNPGRSDWEWLADILDRIFLLLSLFSVMLLCGLIIFLGAVEHLVDK